MRGIDADTTACHTRGRALQPGARTDALSYCSDTWCVKYDRTRWPVEVSLSQIPREGYEALSEDVFTFQPVER